MNKARDRDLVRLHWPVALRPAFDALFDIDDAMASVVARATEPTLAAIKLAWWREQLERLDTKAPPAEPRLQAAAVELLPRGIKGHELAAFEMGWAGVLEDLPDMAAVGHRGTILFEFGARLLGAEFTDATIGVAGRLFAGVDAARRGVVELAAGWPGSGGQRIPRRARPLTGLAALAARDLRRGPPFEPEGTPGRSWTLIRHRLSGRI
jgi:phytoene synthase